MKIILAFVIGFLVSRIQVVERSALETCDIFCTEETSEVFGSGGVR